MYKIGLIGCGHVALSSHLPAIMETEGLVLHALCDPEPARLKQAGEQSGSAQLHTDPDRFFRSGIDAVVVTSPAYAHKDNVMQAARYRLPVLCEKPLAMDREEGEAMCRAMTMAGVPLYTGFCYRFSPVSLAIRRMVAEKAIGEVRSLRLIYNWPLHGKYVTNSDGTQSVQARREGRMLEGGPMVDCGTHQIDLARFWLGSEVIRYSGHGAWVEDYVSPDHMWLHLDHANGAHTTVEVSYSYHQVSRMPRKEFVYELIGTEGVIRYDREERSFTLDHPGGREVLPYADEKNFPGMYAEFTTALATGQSDLLAGVDESLCVIDIARESTLEAIDRRSRLALEPSRFHSSEMTEVS